MQSYSSMQFYQPSYNMMMPTFIGIGITSATASLPQDATNVLHMGSCCIQGLTTIRAIFRVGLTAQGLQWAEAGIYRGVFYMLPSGLTGLSGFAGPSASLERLGYTSINNQVGGTSGNKTVTIYLDTVTSYGDELWFAIGTSSSTRQPEFTAIRPDPLATGLYQTTTGPISTISTFTGNIGLTSQLLPMVYLFIG